MECCSFPEENLENFIFIKFKLFVFNVSKMIVERIKSVGKEQMGFFVDLNGSMAYSL